MPSIPLVLCRPDVLSTLVHAELGGIKLHRQVDSPDVLVVRRLTAQALEAALRGAAPNEIKRGKSVANEEGLEP